MPAFSPIIAKIRLTRSFAMRVVERRAAWLDDRWADRRTESISATVIGPVFCRNSTSRRSRSSASHFRTIVSHTPNAAAIERLLYLFDKSRRSAVVGRNQSESALISYWMGSGFATQPVRLLSGIEVSRFSNPGTIGISCTRPFF